MAQFILVQVMGLFSLSCVPVCSYLILTYSVLFPDREVSKSNQTDELEHQRDTRVVSRAVTHRHRNTEVSRQQPQRLIKPS